jgi:hypothetical protein
VSPRLKKFNAPLSFAYQEDKNVERAVAEILELSRKYRFAVEADIKSYFDQIPVKSLSDALFRILNQPSLRPLIEAALEVETEIIDTSGESSADYFKDDPRGIPQGSALSPTLANYYLAPLDYLMAEAGIPTIRYADDLVFFAETEDKALEAFGIAAGALRALGLDLHPLEEGKTSKSKLRDLKMEGLESLGYRVEQGRIQPGSKFVRRMTDEIREITNPASVGVGFKGAPTTWTEDTVLSRAYYLRKKVEGKAAAIRLSEECPQIMDIDRILVEGFYNLFTASGIDLKAVPEHALKRLGIPGFKEIWEKKHLSVPAARVSEKSISDWLKEASPLIRKAFPHVIKTRPG